MNLCGIEVGLDKPLFLIAGPCVVESLEMARETAGRLKEITHELSIPFIYKSSFDKANRSSHKSFRGLGIEKGLQILSQIKKELNEVIGMQCKDVFKSEHCDTENCCMKKSLKEKKTFSAQSHAEGKQQFNQ